MCTSATVAPRSQSTYRVGVGRLARHSAHIPRSSSLDGIGLNKTKEVSVLKVLVGKLVEGTNNASPFFLGHSAKALSSTQAVRASIPGFYDLPVVGDVYCYTKNPTTLMTALSLSLSSTDIVPSST